MTVRAFERAVRTALADVDAGNTRLLTAVSGGPDSLALLYSLYALREELGLELVGAHLDHGLRGEESAADAAFVESVFETLSLDLFVESANVLTQGAASGTSLEEAAREARYDFLARSAAACGAAAVALGHTSDDQAETVLMNIIRGSGLSGLKGMRTLSSMRRRGAELMLMRPLLGLGRAETTAYCEALGLKPRFDRSNLSTNIRRNRVRIELMPALTAYNPAIRESLLRLSASTSIDLAFLEEETDKAWRNVAILEDGRVQLRRRAFSTLPEAVGRRLLRKAVLYSKGDLKDVELNHVEGMARLMNVGVGSRLDLPGGIRFEVGYDIAIVGPQGDKPCVPRLQEFELEVPGRAGNGIWQVETRCMDRGKAQVQSGPDGQTAQLDLDEVGGPLVVRGREPGDRFQPLGMVGSKSLKDFLVDSKVPRARRGSTPLVVSQRGIVWVVGLRIAHWARVREGTSKVLEIEFRRAPTEGTVT